MKRLMVAVLATLIILAGVLVIRALPSADKTAIGTPYPLEVDVDLVSDLMSKAIQLLERTKDSQSKANKIARTT